MGSSYNNPEDAVGKHVLCVDDDPDTCEMISVLLKQSGFRVSSAFSVAEGLALVKAGGFDLILLDWYFPDGSGLELCRKIREFDASTPILFLTGMADETELKQAMSAGAQGYLVKPFGADELSQIASQYVGEDSGKDSERGQ